MSKQATAAAPKQRAITSERVQADKPASRVINKFGGLTRFCNLTGYPISTAHGWTVSGYIPPMSKGRNNHQHIIATAKSNEIALAPIDFVDPA